MKLTGFTSAVMITTLDSTPSGEAETVIEESIDWAKQQQKVEKIITKITAKKHYPLLETLAEKIFFKLFENPRIKKILFIRPSPKISFCKFMIARLCS